MELDTLPQPPYQVAALYTGTIGSADDIMLEFVSHATSIERNDVGNLVIVKKGDAQHHTVIYPGCYVVLMLDGTLLGLNPDGFRRMWEPAKPLLAGAARVGYAGVTEHSFDHHAPSPEAIEKIKAVREATKAYFRILEATCPSSPELTLGLRDLQTCQMRSIQAIVLNDAASTRDETEKA